MMKDAVGSFRIFFLMCITLLGYAFCTIPLPAQEQESAVIYNLEGADFTITLDNRRVVFSAEQARGEGIRLEPSGIVNTGPGTLLELRLAPSGSVIKLAENTSFVYNGIDSRGRTADVELLYGRIRVITGNSSERNLVVIRGGGVSARVREGDFGVDYFLDPGNWNFSARPSFR
jgi:hypothetical protein